MSGDNGNVDLNHAEILRYSRHLLIPEVGLSGQKKIKAVLQELGHGENARLEEVGQEEERDNDQCDGCHPFIARYSQPEPLCRAAAHPYELLGGDIGGDQAEADQPPGQTSTGEEVVLGILVRVVVVALALPETDADDGRHEYDKYENVDNAYAHSVLPFGGVSQVLMALGTLRL